jgi:hypothetical protein
MTRCEKHVFDESVDAGRRVVQKVVADFNRLSPTIETVKKGRLTQYLRHRQARLLTSINVHE